MPQLLSAKDEKIQSWKYAYLQNFKVSKLQSANMANWKCQTCNLSQFQICQNCLSLSLSCLYQDRHGDTHAALNLHLLPPIQRCAHIFEQTPPCDLCMCSCKQDCYRGRHLKPPTHLQIYCLLENCRVELGSVWLYGLRGGMMVPLRASDSGHLI